MSSPTTPIDARAAASSRSVVLPIRGMTCAACARLVQRGLASQAGVVRANVTVLGQRATVVYDPSRTDEAALVRAIADAGYEAVLPARAARTEVLRLAIDGMTCAACVRRVEDALRAVRGVEDASVSLALERASVTVDPDVVTARELATVLGKIGYRVLDREARGERDLVVAVIATVQRLVLGISRGAIARAVAEAARRWFAPVVHAIAGPRS